MRARLSLFEDAVGASLLLGLACLPLMEFAGRRVGLTWDGTFAWISVLTLAVAFFGASLAAREGRHLGLSTGEMQILPSFLQPVQGLLVRTVSAVTVAGLCWGAWLAVEAERSSTEVVPPGIPAWVLQLAMPLGYAAVTLRFLFRSGRPSGGETGGTAGDSLFVRALSLALAAGAVYFLWNASLETAESIWWVLLLGLLLVTVLGAPIFVALGGMALVLFWSDEEPIAAVASETVRLMKSPILPTIPLFTLAGFVLAESNASERLVNAFRKFFAQVPGGLAVMATAVCAYFTTFTGASGVTILALGGLLMPMLLDDGFEEGFNVGLLTASGSIGLLFFPSLPVILYGVVAHVPVDQMFVAAFLPGLVLVLAVSLLGVKAGYKARSARTVSKISRLHLKPGSYLVKLAAWELALPAVVLSGFLLGTLVEAAALTVAYVIVVEVFVHKDLGFKDLVRVGRECSVLVGGVMMILGVAMGLTGYLVDAEVPAEALSLVREHIESKYVFLIALNLLLLLVGCLMDIFSAIAVVVPLILPMAEHFQIDPIHLGVIFLANLELGFLTPPVGMNLFLSSFRFNTPLTRVYRYAFPFLLVLLVAVLLITYVPGLSLWPVQLFFGDTSAPPVDL